VPFRVAICGSRFWTDRNRILHALQAVQQDHPDAVVVHGAAPGADSIADSCARQLGLPVEAHPANWRQFGRAAGPRRNQEMVDSGLDLCLAFRLNGSSPGTDDMIRRCRAASVPVLVYDE
jgi:hypothetical protein